MHKNSLLYHCGGRRSIKNRYTRRVSKHRYLLRECDLAGLGGEVSMAIVVIYDSFWRNINNFIGPDGEIREIGLTKKRRWGWPG